VLHSALDGRVKLDAVNGQTGTLGKVAELLGHCLDLDSIKRDERGLAGTLLPHVLDALNGGLLLVDNNRVDIAAEDSHDSKVILGSGRLAEVNNAAVNTGEDAAEVGEGLLQLDLAFGLALVRARLKEPVKDVLQVLVDSSLAFPERVRR